MLEAVERTKGELGAKEEELAAIRAEFEQKKKEVRAGDVGGQRGWWRWQWKDLWRWTVLTNPKTATTNPPPLTQDRWPPSAR